MKIEPLIRFICDSSSLKKENYFISSQKGEKSTLIAMDAYLLVLFVFLMIIKGELMSFFIRDEKLF